MPTRSKRECPHPGCRTLTLDGRCDKHKRVKDRHRRTAHQRGYDWAWRRLRNTYINHHPVCEIQHHCNGAAAEEVDHIVPLKQGGAKLDQANLQSTCKRCHSWKTRTQDYSDG